jgi:hypothetical protein
MATTKVYFPWNCYGDMSGGEDVLNHAQQSVAGSQQMVDQPATSTR